MVLLLFAALGCALGFHYHTTRAGYATLAFMALFFPLLQIADVVLIPDRNAQTMLPLIVGLTTILSTILGAGVRLYSTRSSQRGGARG